MVKITLKRVPLLPEEFPLINEENRYQWELKEIGGTYRFWSWTNAWKSLFGVEPYAKSC